MANELSRWFKDNCKDIGHINYGKIRQLIESQAEPCEEWVEEKATKFLLSFPGTFTYQYQSQLKNVKDFIRTLAKGLPMRKPKVDMQYLHDNILCPHCKRYETKTLHCDYCAEEITEVEK